jgi:CHRD domain-containing protein
MKKLLLAGSLAVLVAGLVVAVAVAGNGKGTKHLSGELDGFQEVPAISTNADGEIDLKLNGSSIQYKLEFQDLSSPVKFAHIHFSEEHVNGGVVAFLCGGGGKPPCPQSGTVTGTITAADVQNIDATQGIAAGEIGELIRAIKHGATYANVHSDKFPNGEIRGQIGDDDDDHHGDHNGERNGERHGNNGGHHDNDHDED